MILVPLIFMLFYFPNAFYCKINGIKMEFVSIGLYVISLILASSWEIKKIYI